VTGNDIVDRKAAAAESNWQRKGFLQKIFTSVELEQINNAAEPEKTLWRLWSMKESAYKIFSRQTGNRFFAPQKFCSHIINEREGTVHAEGKFYQTITCCTEDFIYSTAKLSGVDKPPLVNNCFRIRDTENFRLQPFLYTEIISSYISITGKEETGIRLIKDKTGAPSLFCRSSNDPIPLSITHHGRYAAFTIY
jgi:phosphopantetheinyl transferase (holo-ACP synthase)